MVRPTADALIQLLRLEPLPVEGGMFRQTWRAQTTVTHSVTGREVPAGTVIYGLLTAEPDSFSALHRLPTAEVWHFYLGDPIELLLLHPDGSAEQIVLGPDLLAGQHVQFVIGADIWMGARLLPGGDYGLFGTTMAPGFIEADYQGGDQQLAERYPQVARQIQRLLRPGNPTARQ